MLFQVGICFDPGVIGSVEYSDGTGVSEDVFPVTDGGDDATVEYCDMSIENFEESAEGLDLLDDDCFILEDDDELSDSEFGLRDDDGNIVEDGYNLSC